MFTMTASMGKGYARHMGALVPSGKMNRYHEY
jgi:hypothetical protein